MLCPKPNHCFFRSLINKKNPEENLKLNIINGLVFFFSAIIVTVPPRLGKLWVLSETQKSFNGGSNLIDSQVDNSSDFDMHMNSLGFIESILRLEKAKFSRVI